MEPNRDIELQYRFVFALGLWVKDVKSVLNLKLVGYVLVCWPECLLKIKYLFDILFYSVIHIHLLGGAVLRKWKSWIDSFLVCWLFASAAPAPDTSSSGRWGNHCEWITARMFIFALHLHRPLVTGAEHVAMWMTLKKLFSRTGLSIFLPRSGFILYTRSIKTFMLGKNMLLPCLWLCNKILVRSSNRH